jgi:hypothetical protein
MNKTLFYIEYHWAKRRPVIEFELNNNKIYPTKETIFRVDSTQENSIVEFDLELSTQNIFSIHMCDKTNNDMIEINGQYIDHWVKIMEIEIDNIKFETALYNSNPEFRHSMPQEWVSQMRDQGHEIQENYHRCTEIRLNGTWTLNFNLPIWQWCTEHFI